MNRFLALILAAWPPYCRRAAVLGVESHSVQNSAAVATVCNAEGMCAGVGWVGVCKVGCGRFF